MRSLTKVLGVIGVAGILAACANVPEVPIPSKTTLYSLPTGDFIADVNDGIPLEGDGLARVNYNTTRGALIPYSDGVGNGVLIYTSPQFFSNYNITEITDSTGSVEKLLVALRPKNGRNDCLSPFRPGSAPINCNESPSNENNSPSNDGGSAPASEPASEPEPPSGGPGGGGCVAC